MRIALMKNAVASASFLALVLSGCGDGSTTSTDPAAVVGAQPSPASPAAPVTPSLPSPPDSGPGADKISEIVVSGVVATGAACSGAPVTLLVASTAPQTVRSASDGSYTATLGVPAKDAAKPLVVQAECPNAAGGKDTLVSVAPTRSSGTINVNPLTNLISALLTKSGDPKLLGIELENGTISVDASAISAKSDRVREILLPVLNALTLASTFDPIKGRAEAYGTGFDRLLDMLDIQITPEADNTSTIAMRLKLRSVNETDSQPVIRFTNVTALDKIKLDNAISAVSIQQLQIIASLMIPNQTSALIADLIGRINTCYALNKRSGAGADALAPACSAAFVDGSVANFRENGIQGVQALGLAIFQLSSADSQISTLLSDRTALQFSMGTFQYLRANGVLGFTARKTSVDNTVASALFEAKVGQDGKLGLSGNQYQYEGKVLAQAERRDFLNQKNSNYLSTGVNIRVPLQNKDGVPITKIVVTPPADRIPGNQASFTMLPGSVGMALPLQNEQLIETNSPAASGFLRLRTEYTDVIANANRRHPSRRDFGQYFANDLSELALQQFSTGDVWTIAFYVGNATTPDVSQYYRLSARPFTIGEFRSQAMPDLEISTKAFLRSLLVGDGGDTIGISPLTGLPPLSVPWTGTPLPIESRVYGFTAPPGVNARVFFTDVNFLVFGNSSGETVQCSNGSNGDRHCAANRDYASGAILEGVELVSRLPDKREHLHHFSVEQLLP